MGKKKSKKKQNRVVTDRLAEQMSNENEEHAEGINENHGVKSISETTRVSETKSAPEIKDVMEEQPKSSTLADSLGTALYGDDFEEIRGEGERIELPEEESEEEPEKQPERPNKFYLVFAVFIIVMSIIGMVSTVRFGVQTVNEIANQTSLKNEIALFLYPIVTVDPPEFTEIDEIPSSVIIESAIWRIILTGDNSNYEKLYNTYMYVPAVDVEFSVKTLYGSSAEIIHQTVGSASSAFTYVENQNSYLVPISPRYTAYSPVVTDISNIGELYTVTVEYMPPTALAIEGIKLENTTTKTMVYTLSKSKNTMVVHSAKNATTLGDVNVY